MKKKLVYRRLSDGKEFTVVKFKAFHVVLRGIDGGIRFAARSSFEAMFEKVEKKVAS